MGRGRIAFTFTDLNNVCTPLDIIEVNRSITCFILRTQSGRYFVARGRVVKSLLFPSFLIYEITLSTPTTCERQSHVNINNMDVWQRDEPSKISNGDFVVIQHLHGIEKLEVLSWNSNDDRRYVDRIALVANRTFNV